MAVRLNIHQLGGGRWRCVVSPEEGLTWVTTINGPLIEGQTYGRQLICAPHLEARLRVQDGGIVAEVADLPSGRVSVIRPTESVWGFGMRRS